MSTTVVDEREVPAPEAQRTKLATLTLAVIATLAVTILTYLLSRVWVFV